MAKEPKAHGGCLCLSINLDGFSFPQDIVNRKHMFPLHSIDTIVQSANYPKNLSLRHGLIGKILFFYVLAERTEEIHYKEYAESLMEVLFEDICINMPTTFFDGLSGIGWCIQYLISNQFCISIYLLVSKPLQRCSFSNT